MKKVMILLAMAMLVSSAVGCGCCRRFTSLFNRGAYCGPSVASPTYVAPPTPVVAPTPMVVPTAQCAPQCIPCQPCCDPCTTCDPCCETYGYGGCDTCGGMSGTIGTIPTSSMGVDPGPVPPGP